MTFPTRPRFSPRALHTALGALLSMASVVACGGEAPGDSLTVASGAQTASSTGGTGGADGVGGGEGVDDGEGGSGGDEGVGGAGGAEAAGGAGGSVAQTYTIGGSVSGLRGSLTLDRGDGTPVVIGDDGSFTLGDAVEDGTTYEVSIVAGPGVQRCQVSGADGTVAGADVADVLVECVDLAFFYADDGVVGSELWVSDGTAAGTALVVDINASGDSGSPGAVAVPAGDKMVFNARDDAGALELWATDGTAAGTTSIARSFDLGQADSRYVGDTLIATAGDAVWKTDGTAAGTSMLVDAWPSGPSGPRFLDRVGQRLFFYAKVDVGDRPLWQLDVVTWQAAIVPAPNDNSSTPLSGLGATVAGGLVFRGDRELWVSDGSEAGTQLLLDINPNGMGDPTTFHAHGDEVYFHASDGLHGRELWKSDGTAAGTMQVLDITPGADSSTLSSMVSLDDTTLLFVVNHTELWKTDGTAAGTSRLHTFDTIGGTPQRVGDRVVFGARDGEAGIELWQTDGTAAGTTLLADINPGADSSSPVFSLTSVGNQLLFTANDGVHGSELWATDGTAAGTHMVKDIHPGPGDSFEAGF